MGTPDISIVDILICSRVIPDYYLVPCLLDFIVISTEWDDSIIYELRDFLGLSSILPIFLFYR